MKRTLKITQRLATIFLFLMAFINVPTVLPAEKGIPPSSQSGVSTMLMPKKHSELKKAGLKNIEPRRKILNILHSDQYPHHMSAEELYKILLDSQQDIGLATVYRVLTQFEQAGQVIRHNFNGTQSVFELETDQHHDHMIDIESGKVIEFTDKQIEQQQQKIAKQHSYDLIDHRLVLYVQRTSVPPSLKSSLPSVDPGKLIRHTLEYFIESLQQINQQKTGADVPKAIKKLIADQLMSLVDMDKFLSEIFNPYWKEATHEQRKSIENSLAAYQINLYSGVFNAYKNIKKTNIRYKKPQYDESGTIADVAIRLTHPDKPPYVLIFVLNRHPQTNQWKIFNLRFLHVDLVQILHQNYALLLEKSEFTFDELTVLLKEEFE